MSIVLDGTTGLAGAATGALNGSLGATTPSTVVATTISGTDLTTTGNTILGDASTDTLNVGNGGLVKDASGNVGIGTSSPIAKLDVRGILAISNNAASYWALDRNDSDGSLTFTDTSTERMRIDASGNLLVGKTGTSLGSVGFQADGPNGVTRISNSSTINSNTVWEVYSTGASTYRFYVGMAGTVFATNTTISSLSDVRFKENIRDLDSGLAEIMALQPRLYDWKEGKGANVKNARGFIAQEFEQVFPDLIDDWKEEPPEGEEAYKSVRADLIPVLVKAIQELNAKFEEYKASHP